METVRIFDTTLRDGEQSPGISLDVAEKLEIAEQLARLGVDIIEAGFPIASDGDFESVEAIAKSVKGPIIAGLSRTGFKDVDRAWEAVRHADKPRIHVFIATSKIHMEKKLRMTPEQVKHEAGAAVARAKSYVDDVEFSPEDGYRSDPDFMCEVCQIAVDSGATTINIPDTVGFAVPEDFGKLIRYVIDNVKRRLHRVDALPQRPRARGRELARRRRRTARARWSARSTGWASGPGNAALEEIVMAIRTRSDHFEGIDVGVQERGARAHVASGVASHRISRAVQQGGRRSQRVRARGRHPPARRARRSRDLRDHRRVDGRARSGADRARQALRAVTPLPTRSRRWASTCTATR